MLLLRLPWLLSAFSLLTSITTALPVDEYTFQSGPDHGNSYGSSIQFDHSTNQLYITGSTYGSYWHFYDNNDDNDEISDRITKSTCFVGIINFDEAFDIVARTFPNPDGAPESCKQLLVAEPPKSSNENHPMAKVLLLGNTRNGGTLSDLHVDQFTEEQYGMILDVDVHSHQVDPKDNGGKTEFFIGTEFLGGRLLQDGPVQYPMGMALARSSSTSSSGVQDYYQAGDLYVVSMQSFDTAKHNLRVNEGAVLTNPLEEPDLNQLLEYGSSYTLLVERFFPAYEEYLDAAHRDGGLQTKNASPTLRETWMDGWRKPYAPNYLNGETIHVAGITTYGPSTNTNLIVMGSTAAHGSIFGTPMFHNGADPKTDIDGFIALLSASDGSYREDFTLRIESTNMKDDYITGFCQHDNHLFIVGTTHGGQMEGNDEDADDNDIPHAFVVNVDMATLQISWVKQLDTPKDKTQGQVHGVACSVTHDGQFLYFGGTIKDPNGYELYNYQTQSYGGDDVFLVQFDTTQSADDNIRFVKQWGTSRDDHLVDITTDNEGNAVVLGNTNGSILRRKKDFDSTTDTTDIFIVVVSQDDGSIKEPMDLYGNDGIDNTDKPDKNDIDSNTNDNSDTNNDGDNNNDNDTSANSAATTEESNGRSSSKRLLMAVLLAVAAIVVYIACRFTNCCRRSDIEYLGRSQMVKDLDGFHIHDIDLKRSATGGWHGNYNNDLAEGLNHHGILTNPTLDNTKWRYQDDPAKEESLPPVNFSKSAAKKRNKQPQMSPLVGNNDGDDDDEDGFVDEPLNNNNDNDDDDTDEPRSKSIHADNIKQLEALMKDHKPWKDDARVKTAEEHALTTII